MNTTNLLVYKDNSLVEASYKLTLIEQRLMLYCISKLNPESPQQEQVIIVDDFTNEFPDVDKNSAYKQIKKAIENLYQRSVKVQNPKFEGEFRWISSKKYFSDGGKATISFSNEIMPYLCQLEKQFTNYQLRNIKDFKSIYSIRVYELLTQYRSLSKRSISLSELRVALQLEDKFKEFKEFRRSVIEVAVNEINEKSDLSVSYELVKSGRSVHSLDFSIKVKKEIKQKERMKELQKIKNILKI